MLCFFLSKKENEHYVIKKNLEGGLANSFTCDANPLQVREAAK